MEYGIVYIKICPKEGTPGDWIKYCHLLSATPMSFQKNVSEIAADINFRYMDDIVIPMDVDVHPGCVTKPDRVKEIAEEMYSKFSEMAERQGIPNSIRCVYSVGEMEKVDYDSAHYLPAYPVMIEVGRFLDSSDEPGIFPLEGSSVNESMEELKDDVADIMRELEDEGFIIAFERLNAGEWDKTGQPLSRAHLELNITRPWDSTGRKIPGLPDPPGGLYPGRIFAWKEVKDAVIRLCDWYYSHSDRDYSPGIGGGISRELQNLGVKVETKSPFRMFTGGTEFGIGWHSPEDFDGIGDAITFNNLRIVMRT